MKSLVENNGNKFQSKQECGRRTTYLSFFRNCDLRKHKIIKGHIFLNIKYKKRYMKIDAIFSATKVMKQKNVDPFGGKT